MVEGFVIQRITEMWRFCTQELTIQKMGQRYKHISSPPNSELMTHFCPYFCVCLHLLRKYIPLIIKAQVLAFSIPLGPNLTHDYMLVQYMFAEQTNE